jgi:methionyl-tRNA formyltransferase
MIRLLIVTQDDPFYLPRFFETLIPLLDKEAVRIEGVVIQRPLGKRSLRGLIRQMWEFYGPTDFLRMGFRFVVKRLADAVALGVFRGRIPGAFSVRHVLLRQGWPILGQQDIHSKEILTLVRDRQIDLIVSVAASQKFRPEVLSAPRYGCINIHNARLPKNRGMLPNFWALYNYDREPMSAVTVHKMNEALDDGPIILQKEFELDHDESLHDLIIRTKRLSAMALSEVLGKYQAGEPPLFPNDAAEATYHSFPSGEDVSRFREKGLRLL